jgi:hypothetical protein
MLRRGTLQPVAFCILVEGGFLVLRLVGVYFPWPANPSPSPQVTTFPDPQVHPEPKRVPQSPPVPTTGPSLPQISKVLALGVLFVIVGVGLLMHLELKGGLIGIRIGLVVRILSCYL